MRGSAAAAVVVQVVWAAAARSAHIALARACCESKAAWCTSARRRLACAASSYLGNQPRRWFWTCGNLGDQCNHFKWADDTRPDPPPSASGGQARPSGGQGRGSGAGGSPAAGGSASRAPKRVYFTLREEEGRFGVEFQFDAGLLEVMREHKVNYDGRFDGDNRAWHFTQDGYEAVLASVRAFCDEHTGWQVCPVPAFVTAMLASEHARRDPRPLAIATLASRLPARAGARHCLATDLQPHQREGVIALLRRGGCGLLADEMGLGKTVQAIATAVCFPDDWPLLVMCPASLLKNWKTELNDWLPAGFASVHCVKNGRDMPPPQASLPAGQKLAVVVSYDLVPSLDKEANYGIVVADECHALKSRDSLRTKAATPRISAAARRLCLTGTPLLNRPAEVYPLLQALMRSCMPSFTKFSDRYCAPKASAFGGGVDTSGSSCLAELHLVMMRTLMVRRSKEAAGAALPPKARETVRLPPLAAPEAAKVAAARQKAEEAREEHGDKSGQASAAVMAFYVATGTAKASASAEYMMKELRDAPGLKVIVFAHHKNVLDAAEAALRRAGIPHIRIDGETSQTARAASVSEFQKHGSSYRAAVLSVKAAGVGITLTAATRVIFLELSFSPGLLLQAEDRVHRVGQTAPVTITYLLSAGSADDWIWPMVARKLKITGAATDGRAASMRTGDDVARGGGGGFRGHRVDADGSDDDDEGIFGAAAGDDAAVSDDDEDEPLWQAVKQHEAGTAEGSGGGHSPAKRKLPFTSSSPLPPKRPLRETADGAIDLTGESQLLDDDDCAAPPPQPRATPPSQPRATPPSQSVEARRQSGAAGDAIEID